ncbi:MAG: chromate transporter [Clostridia bacterium]|nr:chromate transporter [Clostridia bacterium]MBR6692442.1 chromate transporter [Clostridia bacterium]
MQKESLGKRLLQLFLTFLKIGAFTFGGGYVMLAIIKDEICEKKKWVEEDELLQVYAIAESTPGPVAINASTYVGYKVAGLLGAIIATLGVVLPAFTIIFLIASYLNNFMDLPIVQNAFLGIKIGVSVLILFAGIDMLKKMSKTAYNVISCIISFVAMAVIDLFSINFSSIYIILIFGVISLFIFAIKNKKEDNK